MVVPIKLGNPKHPTVVYSWEQVLQLKIVARLRQKLSLQETSKVIELIKERGYKPTLFNCHLVLIDSEFHLIEDWKEFGLTVLEASGRGSNQVSILDLGPIGEVIGELQEAARHEVLDFDQRTEGTPLAVQMPCAV
ncbi:MAG TPA: hypothetical protein V6C84_24690 [Coleofasciculaceae cyanobacterium]